MGTSLHLIGTLAVKSITLKALYYAYMGGQWACFVVSITHENFIGQVQKGTSRLYKHNNLLEPHEQVGAGMNRGLQYLGPIMQFYYPTYIALLILS